MLTLMKEIIEAMGKQRRTEVQLSNAFERCWPDFEEGIRAARKTLAVEQAGHTRPTRTTEDILSEMLATQQGMHSRFDAIS